MVGGIFVCMGYAVKIGTHAVDAVTGAELTHLPLDDLTASADLLTGQGRLRDVVVAPDGALWVLTNNTDGRGAPREGDDRILRVPVP